jgi:superoxide dismutase, Fe-Mn family
MELMSLPNLNWFSHWHRQSLIPLFQYYRTRLEEQLQATADPHKKQAGRKLWKQICNLEKQVPFKDPYTLYQTLQQLIARFQNLSTPITISFAEETPKPPESPKPLQEPRVPVGQHQLPPLPYPYDALEPYIDAETIQLHHDKHHQSYVDGLNRAEKMIQTARLEGDFTLLKHWEREAAFHGAGHYLHTIFWEIMNPEGGGEPSGSLRNQINTDFGSFERFQEHFSRAAEQVEGSGWAILVWSPRAHRLEILQAEKHQNLSQQDVIPLLPLDVWEHAYYLKYKNNRKAYIDNWWNVVYWPEVKKRFSTVRKVTWSPA